MPIDRNSAQYITGAIYKPTQTSAPGVWDLDDQANNIAKNLWPLPPQAIQRSLRFNSADSAYLNRTLVAGNRKTWTWSCWFKPGIIADANFRAFLEAFTGSNDVYCSIAYSNGSIYLTQDNGSGGVMVVYTVPVYRDPSAWYHLVVAVDTTNSTSANTVRIYINGVQQSVTGSYPATNLDTWVNGAYSHRIGARWAGPNSSSNFNGYMAEVNFVDGYPAGYTQATFATNNISALFGETDPQTGVWIPKRYTGTYGTNGFRLSFANNSSTTALGYDSSGQGNNWTANNFSVTPGVGNDVLLDVPSMYNTDTGLGGEVLGNYCIMNPLAFSNSPYYGSPANATITNGNLDCQSLVAGYRNNIGTIPFPATGKWYFEATFVSSNGSGNNQSAGISSITDPSKIYVLDLFATSASSSRKIENGTSSGAYASVGVGTIVSVAVDCDNAKAYIAINNSWIDSGNPTTVTNGYSMTAGQIYVPFFSGYNSGITSFNFGQRPFAYAAPTGFKALCTTNLPAPAIGQTAANQADNHFAAVTYIGNGTAQTITGVGFQPDLVWIKNRDVSGENHRLIDSVRGVTKVLYSSITNAEDPNNTNTVTAFTSDGFSVGNQSAVNGNTNRIVAWCWNAGGNTVTNSAGTNGASVTSTYRANRAAGFSIVSWTYNGAATIAHGLNAVPKFMIIRGRNAVYNWDVYHASIGPTVRLVLNSTSGLQTYSGPFNNTTPTSSVFSQGAAWYNNGDSLIGYIFAEIPGYSAFGSYTGNGSADGPFIYTGFKPALILGKRTDTSSTQGWFIFDTARNIANQVDLYLSPSSANNEGTFTLGDMLSNGFKIRNTIVDWNSSGLPYIYAAFAETPARLSTAR